MSQTVECNNNSVITFLKNMPQAYKAKLYEFDDCKASVLGDYLPSKLGMEEGESPIFAFLPGDYSGMLIYVFENGKVAKIPTAGFDTKSNRRRLTGAFSAASPLIAAIHMENDGDIFITSSAGRGLCVNTQALSLKTTKTKRGVSVMTLKKNQTGITASKDESVGDSTLSR